MSSENVEEVIPQKTVTVEGIIWEREKFDTNAYQWIRELDDNEYDWDPETDEVTLVGIERPIRAVSLQKQQNKWTVEGAETAGPDYHRPGFTELISSEYTYTTSDIRGASDKVRDFIEQLS